MKRAKDRSKKEIEVKNLHPKYSVSLIHIKKFINGILKREKIGSYSLAVLFVGDTCIRELNNKYLFKNLPTDVLSFDLKYPKGDYKSIIGDIVVSLDTAERASKALKIDFKEELFRYVLHGILHLTGYDDTTPAQKDRMWKRQEELLKSAL